MPVWPSKSGDEISYEDPDGDRLDIAIDFRGGEDPVLFVRTGPKGVHLPLDELPTVMAAMLRLAMEVSRKGEAE